MRKVEILAPAGSWQSMEAAVNAGCDAVYIGGSRFGARAFADNLTEEDLKRAVDFMHVIEKKLYLTVNTLLKEEELKEELYAYLLPFYEQGLDAVIVQDMGVLSFIHRNFPKLPVHASTQMSLTGGRGAEGLKKFGVTRFVPARELSLRELKEIRRETSLEIETFVHGALCYCYSGQCLLSSMLGGRSGNRGRCAQPCRLPYRLEDGKSGCFLSPRDICTLEILPELIEAGIDSFKIEGRMKRPEYAAFTSYLYGKYVDLYEKLGRTGYENYQKKHKQEFIEDKTALMDLYNRGSFSRGYYTQAHGKAMMSMQRPNHNGVLVGRVRQAGKKRASIRLEEAVNSQDVLEFRGSSGQSVYEYTLKEGADAGKEISSNILPGSKIYPGMEVYRTKNQKLLMKIKEQFLGEGRPVEISGLLEAAPGKPVSLTLTYQREHGEKITAQAEGELVQAAKNQPTAEEKIKKAVMQLQGSGFVLVDFQTRIQGEVFLPVGPLKELRRECLSRLSEALHAPYRRKAPALSTLGKAGKEKEACLGNYALDALVMTKEQAEAALAFSLGRVYLSFPLFLECCKEGMDFGGKEVVFTLPYVLREKNRKRMLRETLELPKAYGQAPAFLVRNLEELFLLSKEGKCILDTNLHVLNKEARAAYQNLGAKELTASLELTKEELGMAGCQGETLLAYGHTPLMITAQCMADNVYGNCKKGRFLQFFGQKGKSFFSYSSCPDCYNIVYDGAPLSLLEEKEAIERLLPGRLRLDFTIEGKQETKEILKAFFEVFRYNKKGNTLGKNTTKGHFYKGIE